MAGPTLFRADRDGTRWLPNLVGDVSIWRLAPDLNHEALFGGCLLEPRTEGSDTLPSSVEWDVTGLLSLERAAAEDRARLETAVRSFCDRVERARALFEEDRAYARFRDAFTLPAWSETHAYLFDPKRAELRVLNWGAHPRGAGARSDRVIGYGALGAAVRRRRAQVGEGKPSAGDRDARGADQGAWRFVLGGLALVLALVLVGIVLLVVMPPGGEVVAGAAVPDGAVPDGAVPDGAVPDGAVPDGARLRPLNSVAQRVYFDVGRDTIGPAQEASLREVVTQLERHPEIATLIVEGHTDVRGREPDNVALSVRRAQRVMRWLIAHGVDEARLRGGGCAAFFARGENETEDGRTINRRVEFYVSREAGETALRPRCVPAPR